MLKAIKVTLPKLSLIIAFLFSAINAAAEETVPLKGFLDSFAYGYQVTIAVNGTPLKTIRGDGQQALRLFAVDHPIKANSPPDMLDLFILKEGENSLVIEFKKKGDAPQPLQVKLEIPDRYSKPLFHLTSSRRPSGKVEKKFDILKTPAPSFATISVDDDNL